MGACTGMRMLCKRGGLEGRLDTWMAGKQDARGQNSPCARQHSTCLPGGMPAVAQASRLDGVGQPLGHFGAAPPVPWQLWERVAVSALCRCGSRRAARCRAPVDAAARRAVAAARRRAGAGQWRPPPERVPQAAAGRSGQPFIPRISGVGSVRGSEGGVHGTGMMHCRRSLGQQPAGQAGHACMQLCGSRLSGANNRFRGGFCPQRFCQ